MDEEQHKMAQLAGDVEPADQTPAADAEDGEKGDTGKQGIEDDTAATGEQVDGNGQHTDQPESQILQTMEDNTGAFIGSLKQVICEPEWVTGKLHLLYLSSCFLSYIIFGDIRKSTSLEAVLYTVSCIYITGKHRYLAR